MEAVLTITGIIAYVVGMVFAAREVRKVYGAYAEASPTEYAESIYGWSVLSWVCFFWLKLPLKSHVEGRRESADLQ